MKIKAKARNKLIGFTLVEMLLVLTILSAIIYMAIIYVQQKTLQNKINKTSVQMQQILNAGLAYYQNNNAWPTSLSCLQGVSPCTVQYLPSNLANNPWDSAYFAEPNSAQTMFYVYTSISSLQPALSSVIATTIAGTLPLAYTTSNGKSFPPPYGTACPVTAKTTKKKGGGTISQVKPCYVVAGVNIPAQNLNNAPAVNFVGLYSHGGCVPVPICPVALNGTPMIPEIMVAPVSVSGLNDQNSTNAYALVSYTAYATSDNGTSTPTGPSPPLCNGSTTETSTTGSTACNVSPPNNGQVANAYWRVCLQVITEKGNVQPTNTSAWGKDVTLMAITRCAINNEPSGTGFTLYSN